MIGKTGDDKAKDPSAVNLGRKGGAKGGPARMANLTPEQRQEMGRRGAELRWHGRGKRMRLRTTYDLRVNKGLFHQLSTIYALRDHFKNTSDVEVEQLDCGWCDECILSNGVLDSQVAIRATLNPDGKRFLFQSICAQGHKNEWPNVEVQPSAAKP